MNKEQLKRIGEFFHLIDLDGAIDLTNIAFMIIMSKIAFASNLDWTAVVTLAVVILNKMHKRNVDSTTPELELNEQIKEQKQQLNDLQNKISPIIDKIQGIIK